MSVTIALAQTSTSKDPAENLRKAGLMAGYAKEHGAQAILFPELFMANFTMHETEEEMEKMAQKVDGEFVDAMRQIAVHNRIWMIFGILEKAEKVHQGKYYNTILIVDGEGRIVDAYRKTHLFVISRYRESDRIIPGDRMMPVLDTPFGRIGMMVCYELRFPEIARRYTLEGAEVLLVPAAWVSGPGKSEQLRTLVRSRAIENTVYVVLCNSCGTYNSGESAVIGPDGTIRAESGTEEDVLLADIDLSDIENARTVMPSLTNRRPELY